MKKIVVLLVGLSVSVFAANAQGKLLNKALNAAGQGVTNAITKKVESVAEKQMEVYLNKKLSAYEQHLTEENKKYQAAMGAWQDSLVAMTSVPFEDKYVFNTLVNSEVVMVNEQGEKETLACTYYMNKDAEYFGYGVENMITVMDYKNNVMVCFSSDEKGKVYFAYKNAATQTVVADDAVEKLSGSKTICGYSCSGYKTINPMYNGTCWASTSDDFAMNYTNLYLPKTSYGFPLYMEGTVYGDNGQKLDYTAEAKSVKKNEKFTIRKADYKNMFE